jgi:hypothetical protein
MNVAATCEAEASVARGGAAPAEGFVRFEGCGSFTAETAAAARALFSEGATGDEAGPESFRALLADACGAAQGAEAKFRFRVRCPLYVAWRLFAPLGAGGTEVGDALHLPRTLQLGILEGGCCRCGGARAFGFEPELGRAAREMIEAAYRVALDTYRYLREGGIPDDQAQMVLPLAAYTEFVLEATAESLAALWRAAQSPDLFPEARLYAEAIFRALRDE